MIIAAWQKRKVLNATTCQKDGKEIFLVTSKEWDLLKMFTNKILAFCEAIEIFFKSKSITSPNVTSAFDLLLNHLTTSIVVLENTCQDVVGKPMSIEQLMVLKGAYIVMKAKLLKYESHVKRKPIFPIATMLDMSLKLEYMPMDEQEYIMKHLKHFLQLVHVAPTSSTCTQGDTLLSNSRTCSKMMVELIKCKR